MVSLFPLIKSRNLVQSLSKVALYTRGLPLWPIWLKSWMRGLHFGGRQTDRNAQRETITISILDRTLRKEHLPTLRAKLSSPIDGHPSVLSRKIVSPSLRAISLRSYLWRRRKTGSLKVHFEWTMGMTST